VPTRDLPIYYGVSDLISEFNTAGELNKLPDFRLRIKIQFGNSHQLNLSLKLFDVLGKVKSPARLIEKGSIRKQLN
jgi:hypothetical protein